MRSLIVWLPPKIPSLAVALILLAGNIRAATLTTLHGFSGGDGSGPLGGLALSGNTLYGTTSAGGANKSGTVFRVNTDGTCCTNLYMFGGLSGNPSVNPDGAFPNAGVLLQGNTLYGTTSAGGTYGFGSVFRINIDGTCFTNLFSLPYVKAGAGSEYDGMVPSGLTPFGDTLYGVMFEGGSQGRGTVFEINTDGSGFNTLHNFSPLQSETNRDGANPAGNLVWYNSILYGTTTRGGGAGAGALFSFDPNALVLATLYDFSGGVAPGAALYSFVTAGLTVGADTLYGAATGGSGSNGVIYSINADGSGFTNIYSFTASTSYDNSDGATPQPGLVLSGQTLYGMASAGGISNRGTIFQLNTDGTGFVKLYDFGTSTNNGYQPCGGLILFSNTLYGTTWTGGPGGDGTVFALRLSPAPIALTIRLAGANVVLSWNDPAAVFSLQSAPALNGVFANIVGATNPFTNVVTATQQFFRLQAN
ncbi:MAG: choice-of-anchor tandem repeat GloVer-containing protein [Limisphaerales bacterium]